MLDDAAKTIPVVRVLLDSDVSIQNTLVQYAFHIEGMSAHEVLLHARIAFELTGSFFFDALLKKKRSNSGLCRPPSVPSCILLEAAGAHCFRQRGSSPIPAPARSWRLKLLVFAPAARWL